MEKDVLPPPEIIVKVDQIQEDEGDSSSLSLAIVSNRRGLLSLIAGLVCVYLCVEFLSRVRRNKNLYSECNSSEVQLDSEPADVIDVNCAYLRTQLSTFEFDRIVTSQNGNKCTIENAGNIVDNLLKVIFSVIYMYISQSKTILYYRYRIRLSDIFKYTCAFIKPF